MWCDLTAAIAYIPPAAFQRQGALYFTCKRASVSPFCYKNVLRVEVSSARATKEQGRGLMESEDRSWWQIKRNRRRPGAPGHELHPAHAHKPTHQRASGQGLQPSDSAVVHSGTGHGPDSGDKEVLHNGSANCSRVVSRHYWKLQQGCTLGRQRMVINTQKNQRRQRDRKKESSFLFLLWWVESLSAKQKKKLSLLALS